MHPVKIPFELGFQTNRALTPTERGKQKELSPESLAVENQPHHEED
jgi:hypothetical protein